MADLERAIHFYRDILGFTLQQRFGTSAAFLGAGGYHHHIGLNTWESRNGQPPPSNSTGLYHHAILYPTRQDLAAVYSWLLQHHIYLDGSADHGVSEALYLRDPDQNGLELYWDRPQSEWPISPSGDLQMFTKPLDLENLLALR